MSSSSIARQNRRKRLRQHAKDIISTDIPTSKTPSTSEVISKAENSEYHLRVDSDDPSFESSQSNGLEIEKNKTLSFITESSFVTCDVSSQPVAKIYLEENRGFREINASQIFQLSCPEITAQAHENSPTYQALQFSKYFHSLSNFCHGLLGGISLLYLIILLHLFSNILVNEDSVKYFSFFSKPIHNVFNFLCIICCVSVFDRLDVSNSEGFIKLIKRMDFKLIAFLIYPICLLLSLSTANVDDKFILYEKNLTISVHLTFKENSEIFYWKTLSISKCFGALLGWIVICWDQNFNMFIDNLRSIVHGKTIVH